MICSDMLAANALERICFHELSFDGQPSVRGKGKLTYKGISGVKGEWT